MISRGLGACFPVKIRTFWMSGTLVFGILVGCLHYYKAVDLTPPLKAKFFSFPPPSYPTPPPPTDEKWMVPYFAQAESLTNLVKDVDFSSQSSIFPIWSPYASRGRAVLQLPTKSYHLSMVELALKGVLCSHHPWQ